MINGARTIKTYGWELFYAEKIKGARVAATKVIHMLQII